VSAEHVETSQTSGNASPLLRLSCDGCGYGVSVRQTPKRCPMCGGSAWHVEGWRPWGDLTHDLDTESGHPTSDAALSRDKDATDIAKSAVNQSKI
jgi:hypothetical protein